jgi:quercetin dioxygenase-like cupin family protein
MSKDRTTKPDTARTTRPLTRPIARFDLEAETDSLRREEPRSAGGHSARTLVKHSDFRIVLMSLEAGAELHEHKVDHSFSLQALTGHVRLQLPDETVDVPAGSMLVLDEGIPHDVVALEASTVLLTISWSEKRKA